MSKVSTDTIPAVPSNLCYRCDALPTDLDGPGSHRRSHEKTDFLIKSFDPGILWDDFGIRHDIVVCVMPSAFDSSFTNIFLPAFHAWISAGRHP